MDAWHREQLRLAFQEPPEENKVRILLATDAASEGIDLHEYCHRLVNYDMPFNPNKLEQRIGRIDRYGQPKTPEVRHFVGAGWEARHLVTRMTWTSWPGSPPRSRGWKRTWVASTRSWPRWCSVGCSARSPITTSSTPPRPGSPDGGAAAGSAPSTDVSEQVRRLRRDLDATIAELRITPGHVKRLVDTALDLDGEQPLRPFFDERLLAEGLWEVPELTKSWARATEGLTEKLEREGESPRRRPVTFDPAAAKGRHDAVYAHLGHPLVNASARLLRAAVWSGHVGLHRVAAVVSDDPELEHVLVGAYSRFVLVGADGIRLHEEVLYAGGWLPETGRFRGSRT